MFPLKMTVFVIPIVTIQIVLVTCSPIDLTWPFDSNTIYWPNNQPFMFTKKIAEVRNNSWYAANEFATAEHGGTHFDAPYHFNNLGWKVGDVPLSRLIVPGIMINLTGETEKLQSEARLLPKHLEAWEQRHGYIPANSVLLVSFGWSKYYSNKTQYLGIDENNRLNFPGISTEAAQWIVNSNKIVGVGVDTASVDAGSNIGVHMIFSAQQIYNLENIKIPSNFPENNFTLYVMPMKIKDGTGAPLRVVAIPYKILRTIEVPISNVAPQTVPWYGHVITMLSSFILLILYAITTVDYE